LNNDLPQVELQPSGIAPTDQPQSQATPQPSPAILDPKILEKLLAGVSEQNRLLTENLRYQKSIRERILAGVWQGLGTVIGATVVVSLIIYGLKQIATVEWISPIVTKVIDDMESRGRQLGPKEPGGNGSKTREN